MSTEYNPLLISNFVAGLQCSLSVIGSLGVILLFAGTPQIIYSTELSPVNLVTFLTGVLFISVMLGGNAIISYKNKFLNAASYSDTKPPEDKPPSYDDLELAGDMAPPSYYSQFIGKPPLYDDIAPATVSDNTVPSIIQVSSITTELPPCPPYSEIDPSVKVNTPPSQKDLVVVPVHHDSLIENKELHNILQTSPEPLISDKSINNNKYKKVNRAISKDFTEIDMSKDDADLSSAVVVDNNKDESSLNTSYSTKL